MGCSEAIQNTAKGEYLLASSSVQGIFLSGDKIKTGYNYYLHYYILLKWEWQWLRYIDGVQSTVFTKTLPTYFLWWLPVHFLHFLFFACIKPSKWDLGSNNLRKMIFCLLSACNACPLPHCLQIFPPLLLSEDSSPQFTLPNRPQENNPVLSLIF